MDGENSEDDDEHDVIVGVQHELPVRAVAVQLLVYLLLLLLLVLMRGTHPFHFVDSPR